MNKLFTDLSDFNASDEHIMPFGKYRGEEISTVAAQDPRYLGWFRTTDWATNRPGVIDAAIQAASVAKVNAAPELTLTDHQTEVVGKLLSAVDDGHRIVRLEGGAGYGKSYAAQAVVKDLILEGYEVAATAVSYVATQVLAKQLDPYGVISGTLARTLKFTKEYDDRGNETYDHGEDTAETAAALLSEGHALVVDECLHPSMEILTNKGFKRIDSLDKSEEVAQFDADTHEIDFVTPLRYVQKPYDDVMVDLISPNALNLSVTANHDVLAYKYSWRRGVSRNSGQAVKFKAVEHRHGFKIPVAGYGTGPDDTLTTEDKFCIAYQADGSELRPYKSSVERHVKMTESRFGFTPLRDHGSTQFGFTKQRKVDQFLKDFSDLHVTRGKTSRRGHQLFRTHNIPVAGVSKTLRDVFDATKFSADKAREFIQYLSLWDGWKQGKKGLGYGTTNKDNADFVQEVCTLAGYRSTISTIPDTRSETFSTYYKVSISTGSDTIDSQGWNGCRSTSHYTGDVFCVTVPAGNIVVRRNGKVCITGNCSMINDRDAVLMANAAKANGGILVLIGDSAQLPPVKQDTLSACCRRVQPAAVATLTVPMRYSEDSALYAVEQAVRADQRSALKRLPTTSDEVALAVNASALIDQYVSNYRNDPAALHRMLLFRRREVVAANARIRRGLFGEGADVVEADEQLMIMSTGDTPHVRDPQPGDQTRYYSGQMFRVTGREQLAYRIGIAGETFEIPHYQAQLDNGRGPVRLMFSVSEHQADPNKLGGPEFTAALKFAREYGLAEDEHGQKLGSWAPYRQLQADFVRVAYTYATSVHRAQGQTCDYAYCHPGSLLQVPGIMGRALTYVAMTRARKHLSVVV